MHLLNLTLYSLCSRTIKGPDTAHQRDSDFFSGRSRPFEAWSPSASTILFPLMPFWSPPWGALRIPFTEEVSHVWLFPGPFLTPWHAVSLSQIYPCCQPQLKPSLLSLPEPTASPSSQAPNTRGVMNRGAHPTELHELLCSHSPVGVSSPHPDRHPQWGEPHHSDYLSCYLTESTTAVQSVFDD